MNGPLCPARNLTSVKPDLPLLKASLPPSGLLSIKRHPDPFLPYRQREWTGPGPVPATGGKKDPRRSFVCDATPKGAAIISSITAAARR